MKRFTGINNSNYRHGMFGTRFYKVWGSMIERTGNPKHNRYYVYGGRGISVCSRWHNFILFSEDMKPSYDKHVKIHGEKNTTIERIDNNGNYESSNCKWATWEEQSRNRSIVKFYEFGGVKLCQTHWANRLGVATSTLIWHLRKGKSIADIVKFYDDKSKTQSI